MQLYGATTIQQRLKTLIRVCRISTIWIYVRLSEYYQHCFKKWCIKDKQLILKWYMYNLSQIGIYCIKSVEMTQTAYLISKHSTNCEHSKLHKYCLLVYMKFKSKTFSLIYLYVTFGLFEGLYLPSTYFMWVEWNRKYISGVNCPASTTKLPVTRKGLNCLAMMKIWHR